MANVLVEEASLQAIADTIRSKLGVADTYLPSEMADAIDDIGGGVTPTGTKQISITANGITTEDVAAYASAEITVNVSGGSSVLSGSFTPESDVNTYTVSALAGTSLNHFAVTATPVPSSVTGHSKRSLAGGFIDYEEDLFFSIATAAAGTSINTIGSGAITGTNPFRIDRTTGTFTGSTGANGGGYFISGVEYKWYAW